MKITETKITRTKYKCVLLSIYTDSTQQTSLQIYQQMEIKLTERGNFVVISLLLKSVLADFLDAKILREIVNMDINLLKT